MVFNATFNNISAISWRSVLLVEETGGLGENTGHTRHKTKTNKTTTKNTTQKTKKMSNTGPNKNTGGDLRCAELSII
jgi:hypothetical protein